MSLPESFKQDLLSFVNEAERRFDAIARIRGWYTGQSFCGVDEESVNFSGWEYWRFGGKEFHEDYISWADVLDPDFEAVLERHKIARGGDDSYKAYKEELEKEAAKQRELAELERLKAKYEQ